MRINDFNKVSQLYRQNSTSAVAKTSEVRKQDRVEISQAGRDYQVAKQAIEKTPDIRTDKVNDIKKRMESGTYNIGAQEVADKLVDSYFNKSV